MPFQAPWIPAAALLVLLSAPGQAAPKKPAAKGPTAAQLQVQLKRAQQELEEARERLSATESLQEEMSAAIKSRDLSRQEAEAARKELASLKATLSENQNSGDSILGDLRKVKDELAASQATVAGLRKELADARRPAAPSQSGSVVVLGEDITPAKPMNLFRITPRVKRADHGIVVVNVLVGEDGEVLGARLLQGLPGESEANKAANEACVEAAKRIVFDPARAADGRTKVRVWQGVGFHVE